MPITLGCCTPLTCLSTFKHEIKNNQTSSNIQSLLIPLQPLFLRDLFQFFFLYAFRHGLVTEKLHRIVGPAARHIP